MSSWRCHLVFAVTSFVLFGLSQPSNAQNVNVTTWHNDNLRTGDNLSAVCL